ncbi:MAG: hypothetical protein WD534_01845 [Phycisphaeraceae bacterium]
MQSLKYLNSVLTVIAVLLTLNLWVGWTDTPAGDRMTIVSEAQAQGVPNAAQQRREMIDSIKQVNSQIGEIKTLLTSGRVKVQAEAPQGEDGE